MHKFLVFRAFKMYEDNTVAPYTKCQQAETKQSQGAMQEFSLGHVYKTYYAHVYTTFIYVCAYMYNTCLHGPKGCCKCGMKIKISRSSQKTKHSAHALSMKYAAAVQHARGSHAVTRKD